MVLQIGDKVLIRVKYPYGAVGVVCQNTTGVITRKLSHGYYEVGWLNNRFFFHRNELELIEEAVA